MGVLILDNPLPKLHISAMTPFKTPEAKAYEKAVVSGPVGTSFNL
jgi:hypothetical protein